jgi:hypothetical protein
MPFDFKAYDVKCAAMNPEELQREWEHYTRLIAGASTSTAVSGLAVPFTLGVSLIGVGLAAPGIHNAKRKREIIEAHLQRHGTTHHTRKRDVLSSMALSGTIGVVTLGVGSAGADAIATVGAEHGISAIVENDTAIKVVTHAALDAGGMSIEHLYTHHKKEKDAHKAFQAAGVFQAVADAKAQEAGYAAQPYGAQPYGLQPYGTAHGYGAGSSSMAQAQYGYGYGEQPPPPAYSAATAPAGFMPDSKSPAVSWAPAQTPYAYGGQSQAPPTYAANPSITVVVDSKAPVVYGQEQQAAGLAAQAGATQQQQQYILVQNQAPLSMEPQHRPYYPPSAPSYPPSAPNPQTQNPIPSDQSYAVNAVSHATPAVEYAQQLPVDPPQQAIQDLARQPLQPELPAPSQPHVPQTVLADAYAFC